MGVLLSLSPANIFIGSLHCRHCLRLEFCCSHLVVTPEQERIAVKTRLVWVYSEQSDDSNMYKTSET
ncbi:MAG: hypothetical protein ACI93R_003955 [Flavobacteriales bacterium]|jgi:hypothetical protein